MSENKNFTKFDLKSGDVILRRNGNVEIVCLETGSLISRDGFDILSDVHEDLTDEYNSDCEYDIIAVRRPRRPADCQFCAFDLRWGELVYERKEEPKEMTLE